MKTSQQWLEQVQARFPQFQILDPIGWSKKHYEYEFNEVLIAPFQFKARLEKSIVLASNEMWNFIAELK